MNTAKTLLPSVLDEARVVVLTDKQDERHVTLLHDFNHELKDVLDFVERLKQFQSMPELQSYNYVHHLSTYSEGWDHSVYHPNSGSLIVNCHSSRLMMPESTWQVQANTVIREVIDDKKSVKRKVWTLYRNDAFQERWEPSYTEHPRDPLRMRQGFIPSTGELLVKEMLAQLRSNALVHSYRPYVRALECWEVKRDFDAEDMRLLWNHCTMLKSLHSCPHGDLVEITIKALDPLTRPHAMRNLSALVEFFKTSPNAIQMA